MEPEKFSELIMTLRLMKSTYPDFKPYNFVNFSELTTQQKTLIENEFGRRKMWIENSLYYNYYPNDDEDF